MKNNKKKTKGKKRYMAWKKLEKNQKEVAKRVTWGDYELVSDTGWGFLDEYLIFLNQLGTLELLDTPGEGYQRRMVPTFLTLLTYGMKILLGIERMNQVPDFLFKDIGLLKLIGFTFHQIENGFCDRGKSETGPMHKNTLADALEMLSLEEVAFIFNEAIKKLAGPKLKFLGKIYAIDATDLITTENYPGCGRRTMEKKGEEVTEYGYKLIMIWDVVNRIPVAAKVVKIQEHEAPFTLELLDTAISNIGDKIKVLVLDRGFISGPNLHKIKHSYNIDFVIPSKKDMDITKDAQGIYKKLKKYTTEDAEAYGVKNLFSFDQYADKEQSPLNAIVVSKWKEEEYKPGKEKVFLTSLPVDNPLTGLKFYGLRTLIENQGFRELKQGWHINKFPQKAHNAVVSHVFLTLFMCAMTSAYRSKEGQKLKEKGIRRYRRNNFSSYKILIITGDYYGIFDIEEFSVLMGKPPKYFMRIDPDVFKKRYGLT